MTRIASLTVVAGFALAAANASAQARVEEKVVGRAAARTEGYALSPKGVHFAVLTAKGSRSALVVDSVEGPEFDRFLDRRGHPGTVANNGVVFSADGARFAYFAAVGTQYILVVDGKELARGDLGPSNLGYSDMTFSPGGKHVYFVDLKPDAGRARAQLVMDGKPGPPSGNQNIAPVFSPDDSHWAYNAVKFGGRPDEFISVVDGKEVPFIGFNPAYTGDSRLLTTLQLRASDPAVVAINGKASVNGVTFGGKIGPAPAGSRWAGIVPAKKLGDPTTLYIDGKEVPEAQNVDQVIFSPDGKRYMAICRNATTRASYVVLDGKKGAEYQVLMANSAAFSADSSRAVYVGNNIGKTVVVVDGVASPGYAVLVGQTPVVLSQKGGRYGYIASDGAGQQLIIDGKLVQSIAPIVGDSLGFSADGSRYAYVVQRRGRGVRPDQVLIVNGQEMAGVTLTEMGIPNIPTTREWWIRMAGAQSRFYTFSPDGRHIAFSGARPGDAHPALFVDGKPLLATLGPGSISLATWSSDGKHLFWTSEETGTDRPQRHARVVVDGAPTSVTFSNGDLPPYAGPWEVGADGVLQVVLFDAQAAKRYRITPGATGIDAAPSVPK